jgi:hypothetical protein
MLADGVLYRPISDGEEYHGPVTRHNGRVCDEYTQRKTVRMRDEKAA